MFSNLNRPSALSKECSFDTSGCVVFDLLTFFATWGASWREEKDVEEEVEEGEGEQKEDKLVSRELRA